MAKLTGQMVAGYKMSFLDDADFWTCLRVFGKSAQTLDGVERRARGSCFFNVRRKGNIGIGDIVVPSEGPFADVPLRCAGFTCQYIEPLFGLPAGKCSALIVETMYPNGMSTGLRFYLPTEEI